MFISALKYRSDYSGRQWTVGQPGGQAGAKEQAGEAQGNIGQPGFSVIVYVLFLNSSPPLPFSFKYEVSRGPPYINIIYLYVIFAPQSLGPRALTATPFMKKVVL